MPFRTQPQDTTGSGRRFYFFEFECLGCEAERQKLRMSSQCEVILLFLNSKSFTLWMISRKVY